LDVEAAMISGQNDVDIDHHPNSIVVVAGTLHKLANHIDTLHCITKCKTGKMDPFLKNLIMHGHSAARLLIVGIRNQNFYLRPLLPSY
jgi:hypothetical protein